MQIIYILFEKDSPFFHAFETSSACFGVFVFWRRCLYLIMCKNVCFALVPFFLLFFLLLFYFLPFTLYFSAFYSLLFYLFTLLLLNKASLQRKQGFFGLQTRLVCTPKKPCFQAVCNAVDFQAVTVQTPLVSCSRLRFFSHVL